MTRHLVSNIERKRLETDSVDEWKNDERRELMTGGKLTMGFCIPTLVRGFTPALIHLCFDGIGG